MKAIVEYHKLSVTVSASKNSFSATCYKWFWAISGLYEIRARELPQHRILNY